VSGRNDREPGDDERDAGAPSSGAEVDGAGADESGYRRDDYWREEAREGTEPDEVPEPPQGYSFETAEQKAKADAGDGGGNDGDGKGPVAEQGDAGGRDDARIVDD